MKKYWMIGSLSFLLLAACSDETTSVDTEKSAVEQDNGSSTKNDEMVEITMPADLFANQSEEEIRANASQEGVDDVKFNDDGTVTYVMTKESHEKVVSDMEASVQEIMEELKASEEYPSIKNVTQRDDYQQFDLTVDQAAYEEGYDSMALFGLALAVPLYHMFKGEGQDTKITFNLIDEATNETFDTMVYPDDAQ